MGPRRPLRKPTMGPITIGGPPLLDNPVQPCL
nr:MAG TPA: hypothetical protein [Caudoviricetes sp.]